jgi:hypothetical protein
MLVMLTAAVIVLTGAVVLHAREALVSGNRRGFWRWSALSLPFLATACAALWLLMHKPKLLWWVPPTGFSVDWQCTDNVPPAYRVCFRL